MYEAKLSNLAARIAIQTNNTTLNGDETAQWVERMSAEVDALQFEIERNQNVEAAPRAALLETLADARDRVRVLALDQI
jgi:3'-phosphoadenosine 5'-phosphosulfate sulfotransferase (PAPS reductase)/FAD synthetase